MKNLLEKIVLFIVLCTSFVIKAETFELPDDSMIYDCIPRMKHDLRRYRKSLADIYMVVKGWKRLEVRAEAMQLLEKELKEKNEIPLLLLEWNCGIGGYQNILLTRTSVIQLYAEYKGIPWKKENRIMTLRAESVDPQKAKKLYEESLTLTTYHGNAQIEGSDGETVFCTIWAEDGKMLNVFSICMLSYFLENKLNLSDFKGEDLNNYEATKKTAYLLDSFIELVGNNFWAESFRRKNKDFQKSSR